MKEKKTAVITFRTEEWVKDLLVEAANQNKWSVAQTVEEICKQFVCNPKPNTIIVKTKDLAKVVGECLRERKEGATEINIDLKANEEETKIYKEITVQVLECGGLGVISGFDSIKEMTEDQILDIP